MARVTVEDCVLRVPNRFNLVMYAAQRARDISAGAPETVDRDNDKNPVVALREIADTTIELDELQESLILSLQKHHASDDVEEDAEVLESLQQESIILGASGPDEKKASTSDEDEDAAVADESEEPEGETATAESGETENEEA